jgi:hypothetical protein
MSKTIIIHRQLVLFWIMSFCEVHNHMIGRVVISQLFLNDKFTIEQKRKIKSVFPDHKEVQRNLSNY